MTIDPKALEAFVSNYEACCSHRYSREAFRKSLEAYEAAKGEAPATFQSRVKPWMDACFGPEISADKVERNHRFLEEAIELVQANGCTMDEAFELVDYVYGRPQGDINQEAGGAMVTLAALCLANGIDMHQAGETELARIWTMVEPIRAKQAAKPKHSPLPMAVPTRAEITQVEPVAWQWRWSNSAETNWFTDADAAEPARTPYKIIRPLYTHPAPAPGLDPATVTDSMLDAAARAVPGLSNEHYRLIMEIALLKGGSHVG